MVFGNCRRVIFPPSPIINKFVLLCRVIDESCEPCHVDEVFEALVSCDVAELKFEVYILYV
jgi:hypothetical protein